MMPLAVAVMLGKLALFGAGLALLETLSAKMRIFRVPEFLGMAFMLAVLGMLIHFCSKHEPRLRYPAHQPDGRAAAADRVRHAAQRRILRLIQLFAAQGLVLTLNTLMVAATTGHGRICIFPRCSLCVLKVAGAAMDPAPPDRPAEPALGRRNADQHSDQHADRHRAGGDRFQPRAADLTARWHDYARHAGHRHGERAHFAC